MTFLWIICHAWHLVVFGLGLVYVALAVLGLYGRGAGVCSPLSTLFLNRRHSLQQHAHVVALPAQVGL